MNTTRDTLESRFFVHLKTAQARISSWRSCPEYSDETYLQSGIGRVVAPVQSGRDWVQQLHARKRSSVSVSNFFHALRSPRRLKYLQDIAEQVRRQTDSGCPASLDPLSSQAELNGYAVYATDGHYEKPSAHARHAPEHEEKDPVGYFFSLNLRSHSLSLLDIARPVRQREHDMTALKRLGATALRMHEPTGTKVIHVYDPAGIDYAQWHRWKAKGIYLISREKANSTAEVVGENPWDRSDPRNLGVEADQLVGVFCGVLLRRVHYHDPATNTTYAFMTSEMTLPPGLIAFLYKLRWDIEKVFDEKKNKLLEKKAWAGSPVAHCQQAIFVCLTHNLMLLLERTIQKQEGITDAKVQAKRQRAAACLVAQLHAQGQSPNPLVLQCTRMTQRSLQFIRWLRQGLSVPTSYTDALASLRPLMEAYLA